MKYLRQMDQPEMLRFMDLMLTSTIFYTQVRMSVIESEPKVLDNLAFTIIDMVRHNVLVGDLKDKAILQINPEEVVTKVYRNGTLFGIIDGGKS